MLSLGSFTAGMLAGLWLDTLRRTKRAERRHPPDGKFVRVAGGRLHYVEAGQGRPLVLIHGAAFLHGDMLDGHLGDLLRDRFHCISFDRPGHGYSDEYPFHMAPQHQADLLHAAVTRLGLDRPILMGHSLGGAVALAYALRYPDDVAGVVAIAPQAYPAARGQTVGFGAIAAMQTIPVLDRTIWPVLDRMAVRNIMEQAFRPQIVPESFLRSVPASLLVRPVQLRANGQEIMVNLPAMAALCREYRHLRVPLTVLAGTADDVLKPANHAVRLSREVPGARLHMLDGLGHMAHYFAPDAVIAALRDVERRSETPPVR